MTDTKYIPLPVITNSDKFRCKDFDEDCYFLKDYPSCYMYDPANGFCPFLSKDN